MSRIVTDYLDRSADLYPDKLAFVDEKKQLDFKTLKKEAMIIAANIIKKGYFKQPVAVYLEKSTDCISAYCGVSYSGNFYTPLDVEMPAERIRKIMDTLAPKLIITDHLHKSEVEDFAKSTEVLYLDDCICQQTDVSIVEIVKEKILDTDILYVLFTSGSTGMPKGVIISHRALLDFIDWGSHEFDINEQFVFGNQTPFYFSMSVMDIYQTLRNGCTTYIIPHNMFSFPVLLMQYMQEKRINTLFWVPSALLMVSAFHCLSTPHLSELKRVFFGGEVMPLKHLNAWKREYPDVQYVNFYGPTEVTDTCAFYEVNREFEDTDMLPIGKSCRNMDVFLLDDDNRLVNDGEVGEVCVRGSGLSYGYYNDPDRTKEVFVQNPLNRLYPEIIYRTGDLAKMNEYGELVFVSRKDFQIKHMGNRIELGEIENAVSSLEGVMQNGCIYDKKRSKIILFYTGSLEEKELKNKLEKLLPAYMLPNRRIKLDQMPVNLNGKIDRTTLSNMIL